MSAVKQTLYLSMPPEELRSRFYALATPEDVAKLLEIEYSQLVYHIYKLDEAKRYILFGIAKRSGGTRPITAPITALKIIQQKLNQVLQATYAPKPSVHGFLPDHSIVTNARVHAGQGHVFNLDLANFFPSVNFGRVRGMFMSVPYERSDKVATVLAQICCFQNQLPQGAPTSPVVANMICSRLDGALQRLARSHKCLYTRYADDITFSTSLREFPIAIAKRVSVGTSFGIEVGVELERIIRGNGFQINPNKLRLHKRDRRQEVTGLITNQFPNVPRRYIRQLRGMLHAWEKFGYEAAESEFWGKYDKKHRQPFRDPPPFRRVVRGKLDFLLMVRGPKCQMLQRLFRQFAKLEGLPDFDWEVRVKTLIPKVSSFESEPL